MQKTGTRFCKNIELLVEQIIAAYNESKAKRVLQRGRKNLEYR